ncbi:MAG: GNAT family N-acetyltransferase [Bacteroidota bacterium]
MITIGEFKQGTEHEVSQLISSVFDEFVAPDYTEGGVNFFKEFIRPEKFMERIMKGDFILVAADEDKIVGMIEVRDNDHISLLFVDKNYQRRLIAKNLFQEALKHCRSIDPELSMFYVHASPYSIPAYHKIGFAAIGGMKEANGIFYLPMAMTLQSWPAGI